MVNDLSEYLSQKQRIEELEKEVERLKRRNVEWKHKYYKLKEKHGGSKPLTRSEKAVIMINEVKSKGFDGAIIDQIRMIADKTCLSVSHVLDLWYNRNLPVNTRQQQSR